MTLRMYDSINVANLPAGGSFYAGYVNGFWVTLPLLKQVFPHARLLSIAVNAGADADCLDVEPGDAVAAQVPAWVRRQQRRGEKRPCLYASAANLPAVLRALDGAGIKRTRVRIWSAHYGLGPHICGPGTCKYPGVPACDGTQYSMTARGARGSLIDASVLRDDFFTGGDVALSKTDIAAIAKAVWTIDGVVPAPEDNPGNPFWEPQRLLSDANARIRALQAAALALAAFPTVEAIAAAVVAALPPPAAGGITEADVETAVAATFARAFSPGGQ